MVVSQIPKDMEFIWAINMMIVIPMIIQNVTFGYIETFLNNDSRLAITFAGVLLMMQYVPYL
jgi:maltose/moltooligosaccharide transporter